jgi:hypothetical protein
MEKALPGDFNELDFKNSADGANMGREIFIINRNGNAKYILWSMRTCNNDLSKCV